MLSRSIFSRERVRSHTRYSALVLAIGMIGLAVCMVTRANAGLTFFMLIMLGAGTGSLLKWEEERGLWMLALLFLVFFAGFYTLFMAATLIPSWQGRGTPSVWMMVDQVATLAVLGYGSRLMLSMAWHNRNIGTPEAKSQP